MAAPVSSGVVPSPHIGPEPARPELLLPKAQLRQPEGVARSVGEGLLTGERVVIQFCLLAYCLKLGQFLQSAYRVKA